MEAQSLKFFQHHVNYTTRKPRTNGVPPLEHTNKGTGARPAIGQGPEATGKPLTNDAPTPRRATTAARGTGQAGTQESRKPTKGGHVRILRFTDA